MTGGCEGTHVSLLFLIVGAYNNVIVQYNLIKYVVSYLQPKYVLMLLFCWLDVMLHDKTEE